MSVTAGDVARAALADLNEPEGFIDCLRWVAERYTQLAGRRLKQLRRVAELVIPAAVTAGTVTATRGSSTVVGDATAQAVWSQDLAGRFFRTRNAWYEIGAFNGSTLALELKTEFAEDTVTAGTYQVVQRYVTLPADVQFLGTFMHERLFKEIEKWSLTELDLTAPERLYYTSGPKIIAEFGEAPTGEKLVEFYPYSSTTEHVMFTYWAKPPKAMEETTVLPGAITVSELKEGVLVSLKQWKMAEAARAGNVEMAGFWRNEYRAQETVWVGREIPAIVKRDQGVEDKVVLIRSMRSRSSLRSIETARDEVWARGSRP